MGDIAAYIELVGGFSGIAALIGVVIILVRLRSDVKKTEAEAEKADAEAGEASATSADVIGDAWKKLFGQLEVRITHLEDQIKDKDKEIAELKSENCKKDETIARLRCEVDQLRSAVATLESHQPMTRADLEKAVNGP